MPSGNPPQDAQRSDRIESGTSLVDRELTESATGSETGIDAITVIDASADHSAPDAGFTTDAPLPTIDVVLYEASVDAVIIPTDVMIAPSDAASDAGLPPRDSGSNPIVSQCMSIAEDYATQVRNAQQCGTQADCSIPVCETLCCSCRVFANATRLDAIRLTRLQFEWERLGCVRVLPCPATRCGAPARAECTTSMRCVTIRSDAM